jgi:hypothetical protein
MDVWEDMICSEGQRVSTGVQRPYLLAIVCAYFGEARRYMIGAIEAPMSNMQQAALPSSHHYKVLIAFPRSIINWLECNDCLDNRQPNYEPGHKIKRTSKY